MKKCGKCGKPICGKVEERQKRCRLCLKKSRKEFRLRNPWLRSLYHAQGRCGSKNHPSYHKYGARGISCLLTPVEIKTLWERDSADNMEHPSLDRVDAAGNYTITNCRFIGLSQNSSVKRNNKLVIGDDLKIRKMKDAGKSSIEIGAHFGIGARYVDRILRGDIKPYAWASNAKEGE